jgi:hypothetical protein
MRGEAVTSTEWQQYSHRLRTGRRVFDSRQVQDSLFSTSSRSALRPTQTPVQSVSGALSLGAKGQVREADHSPPSSAEIKKGGAILPLLRISSWHSA